MDSFESLLFGTLYGDYDNADKCGRDIVGDYTIDTCDTVDCGYETAIWKGNHDMIIVERYKNKKEAEEGHKKWCKFCENEPKEIYSVQTDEIETF